MSIAQRMQKLFETAAGCRALVLGDLRAGTVLRACAAPDQRQEHHDALVTEAAALFDPVPAGLAATAAGWTGPARAAERHLPGEARLFVVGADGADVICARLAPDAPADRMAPALAALLDPDA